MGTAWQTIYLRKSLVRRATLLWATRNLNKDLPMGVRVEAEWATYRTPYCHLNNYFDITVKHQHSVAHCSELQHSTCPMDPKCLPA